MRKTAIISVTDKRNLLPFAKGLIELKFDILSTGGSAQILRDAGIPVVEISNFTNQLEMLDGRVKTLHPKVHGGILLDRNNPEHLAEKEQFDLRPIDLVVVNLYRFKQAAAQAGLALEDAIDHVDIGGPTMLRAAAKNWQHVLPVMDPDDYEGILQALQENQVSRALRVSLATKVFREISIYDAQVADYFSQRGHPNTQMPEEQEKNDSRPDRLLPDRLLPDQLNTQWSKHSDLRYGENPHQKAALYRSDSSSGFCNISILQGKELSYNNLIDLNAASRLVREFSNSAAVCIVKHTNPCGVAWEASSPQDNGGGDTPAQISLAATFARALDADPKSAFGGIIATNRCIDEDTARLITGHFFECVAAPRVSESARKILRAKKNLRVVECPFIAQHPSSQVDLVTIEGGLLVQESDNAPFQSNKWQTVSKKPLEDALRDDLLNAATVVRHVKSNAIVFVRDGMTLGIGAGQMSRIDAAQIAVNKAEELGHHLQGSILASDAFFPFPDTVELAAKVGAGTIIQPGGSKRDAESIAVADREGICLVFSGQRSFRH